MIRVYLDWNVISNLKSTYCDLKDILVNNQDVFLCPFSANHIDDLLKSSDKNNSYLNADIETLTLISDNQLIDWDFKKSFINCHNISPIDVYNDRKNNDDFFDISNVFNELIESFKGTEFEKIGLLYKKSLELIPVNENINNEQFRTFFPIKQPIKNHWDFFNSIAEFTESFQKDKQTYLSIRKNINKTGLTISDREGSWSDNEVFDKIDLYLKTNGLNQSLLEIIESSNKSSNKKDLTYQDIFIQTYLMLDLIGLSQDKLKKPSANIFNIINDAYHSFYAAHCDFLITDDNNLIRKSNSMYKRLNKTTKVFKPDEFVNVINEIIPNKYINIVDLLNDLPKFQDDENYLLTETNENKETFLAYKLKVPIFGFFDYLLTTYFDEYETTLFMFRKAFQNYSRFLFYKEILNLLNLITLSVGIKLDKNDLADLKKEIYKDEKPILIWNCDFIHIFLEKDEYKISMNVYYNHKKANELINNDKSA